MTDVPKQPAKKKGRANTAGKPISVIQLNQKPTPPTTTQRPNTSTCRPNTGVQSTSTVVHSTGLQVPIGAANGLPHHYAPVATNVNQPLSAMDVVGLPPNLSQWMFDISQQLADIQQKFNSKLDLIERKTDGLSVEISKLNKTVAELDQTTNFVSDKFDEEIAERKRVCDKLGEEVDELRKENKLLRDELLSQKTQSMKDNLLFLNIPETPDEDTEQVALKFIEKDMAVTDVKNLEVVHRFGKSFHGKHRPILVKFLQRKDREKVLNNGKNLKGTNYQVRVQYPREILNRRNRLYPYFKKARESGMRASLAKDVLYIGNVRYTVDNIHGCPVKPDLRETPPAGPPQQRMDH